MSVGVRVSLFLPLQHFYYPLYLFCPLPFLFFLRAWCFSCTGRPPVMGSVAPSFRLLLHRRPVTRCLVADLTTSHGWPPTPLCFAAPPLCSIGLVHLVSALARVRPRCASCSHPHFCQLSVTVWSRFELCCPGVRAWGLDRSAVTTGNRSAAACDLGCFTA